METNQLLSLGLGLEPPWRLVDQGLDLDKEPHELHLRIEAERGARYPCQKCGEMCKAHDFKDLTWRHLNFFQHHCYVTAPVPRVNCPEHGVKRIKVPWARKGSRFTLLFEQVALLLVREMPVLAASRIIGVTDKRLWRVVMHYVSEAVGRLDLSLLRAFGFDETAAKRGHNYVTVFIDLDRKHKPVLFATPGKGRAVVVQFKRFLRSHGGDPGRVVEVVCDMSPAFLSAVTTHFDRAEVTVDWFHVVQLMTSALEKVRRAESRRYRLPKGVRWAVLKSAEGRLTAGQRLALAELEEGGYATAEAWRIKEKLRWVRRAQTEQGAKWRLTHFLRHAWRQLSSHPDLLWPLNGVLETIRRHFKRIIARWRSGHSSARLEGLNGLFKAARARARGYRNIHTFISIIYLIAAPITILFQST